MVSYILLYGVLMSLVIKLIEGAFSGNDAFSNTSEIAETENSKDY